LQRVSCRNHGTGRLPGWRSVTRQAAGACVDGPRQQHLKRLLDTGFEPECCKANTEPFIAKDVFALFGYIGTHTALAALPLVNQAKVPFFRPFISAQALQGLEQGAMPSRTSAAWKAMSPRSLSR